MNHGIFNFSHEIVRGFYSFILGFLTITVIRRILSFSQLFESLILEIKDESLLNQMKKRTVRKIRTKQILFLVISLIFMVAFWYYVIIFCIIYRKNQYKWFKDGWISIIISFIISFFFCINITLCRLLGIHYYSKKMYNLSLLLLKVYLI